jgi:hypothetical protein
MILSPRAINLWRSTSDNRLIRGRYFSTSFCPEDFRCGSDAADFFVFTQPIWRGSNQSSTAGKEGRRSAGFQTCCIADFQIGSAWRFQDAGRSVQM